MELDFLFVGRASDLMAQHSEIHDFDGTDAAPAVGDLVALKMLPSGQRIVFRCVERLWDLSQSGAHVLQVTVDLPE